MKPIKRLLPFGQRRLIEQEFIERLESNMRSMISCLSSITDRLHHNQHRPQEMMGQIAKKTGVAVSEIREDEPQAKVYERAGAGAGPIEKDRKEERFQNVTFPVINLISQQTQQRTEEMVDWLGSMCKEVLSVGFLLLKNDELETNKVKAYCSENILRNLLIFAKQNNISKEQVQKINECLRDQLLSYFCLKYPESEEAEVNMELAGMLVQSDNIEQNANDLVFKSGVKFDMEQSGNYNTQIMQFINYIAKLPNLVTSLKSEQDKDDHSTLADKFGRDMEHIFRKVENQRSVIEMKRFNPKKPEIISQLATGREETQKQKQDYLQKVRSYTKYQIGQKIPKNFRQFTESQVQSGNLRLQNSAIMRVMTKWCSQLQSYFDEQEILGRQTSFRMGDGNQKFIQNYRIAIFNLLLQREKKIILKKMQEIQDNNYSQQSKFSHQKINKKLKKFTEQQAQVGQFTAVMYRNNQNYLINYLNLLIHGINRAQYDYRRILYLEQYGWYSFSKIKEKIATKRLDEGDLLPIMKEVQHKGQKNVIGKGYAPQLITFRIGDLLRCKCSSRQTEITALYKEFERISYTNPSLLKIVRVKNRLDRGNRDILMNLMYKETLLVEVQLAIKAEQSKFIGCSNQFNHFLYELRRAQFGPISEMCSIWVSQDPRSTFYLKHLTSSNKRNKKLVQETKNKRKNQCCVEGKSIELVRLPFTCSNCQCFYYHCSFTEKHNFCTKCQKFTCFLCQLDSNPASQISSFLPELNMDPSKPLENIKFLSQVPQTGGAILNIKSKTRKCRIFKTIQLNNEYYLFEDVNKGAPDTKPKIRLVHTFKTAQIPQSFSTENIIYTSPEIEKAIPIITMQIAQQQYFIPRYLKQAEKTSKNSISQTKNTFDQRYFTENPNQFWPAVKKINFSQNKLTNIDSLFIKMPNVSQANLSQNKITQISHQCSKWTKIKNFNLGSNAIKKLDPNIKYWEQIEELQLAKNQLVEIPDEFCQLKKLVTLSLEENKLTKLPEAFGQLKGLKILNLRQNDLTCLPESITKMKQLKHLFISLNKGITSLPQNFHSLEALQVLDVSECSLKLLPENFGLLSKMQFLNLQNCKLRVLPESCAKMTFLRHLFLFSNSIKTLPHNFGSLRSLQNFSMSFCKMQQLPQQINYQQLVSLKRFDLNQNNISSIPDSFGKLPKLINLSLAYNALTSINKSLFNITTLKILHLTKNKIESVPEEIGNLTNLVCLAINYNAIKDGGLPPAMVNMKSLISLDISHNLFTKVPDFIHEMTQLKQLQIISTIITELPPTILNLKKLASIQFQEKQFKEQSLEVYKSLKLMAERNNKLEPFAKEFYIFDSFDFNFS